MTTTIERIEEPRRSELSPPHVSRLPRLPATRSLEHVEATSAADDRPRHTQQQQHYTSSAATLPVYRFAPERTSPQKNTMRVGTIRSGE